MLKLLKLMKSLWWQLIIVFIFVALQTILQLQLPGYTNEITAQLSQADPLLGPDMNFILMTGFKDARYFSFRLCSCYWSNGD